MTTEASQYAVQLEIFNILSASFHPDGALRYVAKLHDKARKDEGLPLKNFYLSFDVDAFIIQNLASTISDYHPASHGSPLIPSVYYLLGLLNSTVKILPNNSFGDDHPRNDHFPRLAALNANFGSTRNENLEWVAHCVDFGSADSQKSITEAMKDCIKILEETTFVASQSSLQQIESSSAPIKSPNYGVRTSASSLFYTLSNVRICKACEEGPTSIALATHRRNPSGIEPSGSDKFDMLLSCTNERCEWHQVVAEVVRPDPAKGTPRVRFDVGPPADSTLKRNKTKRVKVNHICAPLASAVRAKVRLDLTVENGDLWSSAAKVESHSLMTISLGELFSSTMTSWTGRTKRILAVLFGHALIHLYGGPWLRGWSKEDIIFLQEDGIVRLRPFLSTKTVGRKPEDDYDAMCRLHQHPEILAFGTLLLELDIGQSIESFIAPAGLPSDEINVNTPFVLAKEAMKKRQADMYKSYRDAVNACLDPSFGSDIEEELEEMQRRIYEQIVRPLEYELWQGFHDTVNLDDLDVEAAENMSLTSFLSSASLVPEDSAARSEGNRKRSRVVEDQDDNEIEARARRLDIGFDKRQCRGSGGSRIFEDESDDESRATRGRKPSSKWLAKFRKMCGLIENGVDPNRRVKIAVLDSGVDLEHEDIDKTRIREVRNWVHDAKPGIDGATRDVCGHGTHITGIILTVAPDADIYVAKITDNKYLKDARQVAEAIDFAANEWKADIITMSLGFEKRMEVIEEALDNVRCLVFAAVSNDGGNRQRTYPADHERVICVHSTDSYGNPSLFTPNPKPSADNFSTLGEAIESAWPGPPGSNELKTMSGTSFATPIAAGMAAFVLEYTRQNIKDDAILRRLRKPEGMKEVFHLMQEKRAGYQYLAPWTFFRKDKHSFVVESIINALQ